MTTVSLLANHCHGSETQSWPFFGLARAAHALRLVRRVFVGARVFSVSAVRTAELPTLSLKCVSNMEPP